jgi:hypothetical protein
MNLFIRYLPNYPKDGNHLELYVDFDAIPDVDICKGEDSYYWTDSEGHEHTNLPKFWYVNFSEVYDIETRGFKTPEKALNYAITQYTKYLKNQLKRCKELKSAKIEQLLLKG